MRKAWNSLYTLNLVDARTVKFNLMVGMAGHYVITSSDIIEIFSRSGLWPMTYSFLDQFETKRIRIQSSERMTSRVEQIENLILIRAGTTAILSPN